MADSNTDPKAEVSNAKNEATAERVAGEAAPSSETKTYYLKPGMEHTYIKGGEMITASEPNTPVELTEDGFKSFGDKFNEERAEVKAPEGSDANEAGTPTNTVTPADAPAANNKTAEKTPADDVAPSDKTTTGTTASASNTKK